ncbi:MAG: PorP/SprF family type IX secretion system membrane protein [Melioribacteraceae bacterium]|nr:PorP/SprF family type IX secretion system membrane protein [Melioribacteraceae bacterium]
MSYKTPAYLIFLLLFLVKVSTAQDIHYSQFYNSPINVNPALVGIFNGDQRIHASFRDQWRSVPVPWTSFSMAYDQKFYPKISDKYFISGGVLFNYDRQGLSKLNLSNLNIIGSYTRILNENNLVSLALSLGMASRGFSPSSLTWDQQWDGDLFDPSLPSGENFDAQRVNFVENSIGLNYRYQKTSRTKLDVGIGVFHFIQPTVSFYKEDKAKLPRRFSLSGIGSLKLIDELDLQVHGLAQFQDDYREYLIGGLLKFYVDTQRGKEFDLHLGLGYRTTKSLMPIIAIQYRNIYAAFSYDIDMSEFDEITSNKGGPEIHFNYIITHVKPLKQFKVCPIF